MPSPQRFVFLRALVPSPFLVVFVTIIPSQAMGTTALNMHERMDGLLYALVHPQKPMVTTRVLDLVHFDQARALLMRCPYLVHKSSNRKLNACGNHLYLVLVLRLGPLGPRCAYLPRPLSFPFVLLLMLIVMLVYLIRFLSLIIVLRLSHLATRCAYLPHPSPSSYYSCSSLCLSTSSHPLPLSLSVYPLPSPLPFAGPRRAERVHRRHVLLRLRYRRRYRAQQGVP